MADVALILAGGGVYFLGLVSGLGLAVAIAAGRNSGGDDG